MRKSAVIYYSQTGITKAVADKLAERYASDVHAIKTKEAYKGYLGAIIRAGKEMLKKETVEITTPAADLSGVEVVFVGYPIWYGDMPVFVKDYLEKHYRDGKSDLFAAFILRLLELCEKGGRVGMITMQSWMFLSSFEALRRKILEEKTILSMAHLGAHAFDSIGGEVTQTTAFILANEFLPDFEGTYYRLVDGQNEAEKEAMYREALAKDK